MMNGGYGDIMEIILAAYGILLLMFNGKLFGIMWELVSVIHVAVTNLHRGTASYTANEIEFWLRSYKVIDENDPKWTHLFVWPTTLMVYARSYNDVIYLRNYLKELK